MSAIAAEHPTEQPTEQPPSSAPPARPSLWLVPGTALAYGALGAAYGIALRAWMRLVADDPEFTWAGTIFIVMAMTIGFTMAGAVAGGRRRGWKGLLVPVRILAVVLSLACFGGAGVIMLPTVVLGSLALARTDWPRWLRIGAAVLAWATTLMIVASGPGELGWVRVLVAYVLYLALVGFEIRILSEPYRPSVGRLSLVLRIAAGIGAVIAVLGVLTMTVGVATSGS
jgi:hypothetical protein